MVALTSSGCRQLEAMQGKQLQKANTWHFWGANCLWLSWKFLRTPNSQITLPICAASQASVRHVFKCRNAKGFRFPLSRQKNSKGPLKDNHSAWLVSVCCFNRCWNTAVPRPRKHATLQWKLFLFTSIFSFLIWKNHHITPRNVTPGTPSWQ